MTPRQDTKTLTRDLGIYPKAHIMRAGLSAATALGLPVALWRLPKTTETHLLLSFEPVRPIEKVDLEELNKGFVVAPFDNQTKGNLFIQSDFHVSFDFDELHCPYDFNKSSTQDTEKAFTDLLFDKLDDQASTEYHTIAAADLTAEVDYRQYVQHCVNIISSGHAQKVVPARVKHSLLDESFDPIATFIALGEAYPNAFISLVSSPETGTWMGATPEILIEQENDIFRTVALAGTQKRDAAKSISETAWTQKEIEEQAMVSRYIINCFKKIRLREFEEKGPKTSVAGNLLHLKTEYKVDTVATNFPQLGTVMLELLHPTSAVAGMPKAVALDVIQQSEGFDRELFAGFLGPVNIDGHSNLFVNLRCMQLFEKEARLYAGAGVTEDSDPEKEFQETELKFNTLLNIIRARA